MTKKSDHLQTFSGHLRNVDVTLSEYEKMETSVDGAKEKKDEKKHNKLCKIRIK